MMENKYAEEEAWGTARLVTNTNSDTQVTAESLQEQLDNPD